MTVRNLPGFVDVRPRIPAQNRSSLDLIDCVNISALKLPNPPAEGDGKKTVEESYKAHRGEYNGHNNLITFVDGTGQVFACADIERNRENLRTAGLKVKHDMSVLSTASTFIGEEKTLGALKSALTDMAQTARPVVAQKPVPPTQSAKAGNAAPQVGG